MIFFVKKQVLKLYFLGSNLDQLLFGRVRWDKLLTFSEVLVYLYITEDDTSTALSPWRTKYIHNRNAPSKSAQNLKNKHKSNASNIKSYCKFERDELLVLLEKSKKRFSKDALSFCTITINSSVINVMAAEYTGNQISFHCFMAVGTTVGIFRAKLSMNVILFLYGYNLLLTLVFSLRLCPSCHVSH